MFKTLTDNSKAAIFTVMVLLLTVTVAASINLFSTTSEFLSIVLYMFTPRPNGTHHDAGGHP